MEIILCEIYISTLKAALVIFLDISVLWQLPYLEQLKLEWW